MYQPSQQKEKPTLTIEQQAFLSKQWQLFMTEENAVPRVVKRQKKALQKILDQMVTPTELSSSIAQDFLLQDMPTLKIKEAQQLNAIFDAYLPLFKVLDSQHDATIAVYHLWQMTAALLAIELQTPEARGEFVTVMRVFDADTEHFIFKTENNMTGGVYQAANWPASIEKVFLAPAAKLEHHLGLNAVQTANYQQLLVEIFSVIFAYTQELKHADNRLYKFTLELPKMLFQVALGYDVFDSYEKLQKKIKQCRGDGLSNISSDEQLRAYQIYESLFRRVADYLILYMSNKNYVEPNGGDDVILTKTYSLTANNATAAKYHYVSPYLWNLCNQRIIDEDERQSAHDAAMQQFVLFQPRSMRGISIFGEIVAHAGKNWPQYISKRLGDKALSESTKLLFSVEAYVWNYYFTQYKNSSNSFHVLERDWTQHMVDVALLVPIDACLENLDSILETYLSDVTSEIRQRIKNALQQELQDAKSTLHETVAMLQKGFQYRTQFNEPARPTGSAALPVVQAIPLEATADDIMPALINDNSFVVTAKSPGRSSIFKKTSRAKTEPTNEPVMSLYQRIRKYKGKKDNTTGNTHFVQSGLLFSILKSLSELSQAYLSDEAQDVSQQSPLGHGYYHVVYLLHVFLQNEKSGYDLQGDFNRVFITSLMNVFLSQATELKKISQMGLRRAGQKKTIAKVNERYDDIVTKFDKILEPVNKPNYPAYQAYMCVMDALVGYIYSRLLQPKAKKVLQTPGKIERAKKIIEDLVLLPVKLAAEFNENHILNLLRDVIEGIIFSRARGKNTDSNDLGKALELAADYLVQYFVLNPSYNMSKSGLLAAKELVDGSQDYGDNKTKGRKPPRYISPCLLQLLSHPVLARDAQQHQMSAITGFIISAPRLINNQPQDLGEKFYCAGSDWPMTISRLLKSLLNKQSNNSNIMSQMIELSMAAYLWNYHLVQYLKTQTDAPFDINYFVDIKLLQDLEPVKYAAQTKFESQEVPAAVVDDLQMVENKLPEMYKIMYEAKPVSAINTTTTSLAVLRSPVPKNTGRLGFRIQVVGSVSQPPQEAGATTPLSARSRVGSRSRFFQEGNPAQSKVAGASGAPLPQEPQDQSSVTLTGPSLGKSEVGANPG